ncbi:hypothetical protein AJ80_01531 [Polytolypa hystricis UAMH7299]|uniref:Tyrosine specific protein phosphatases domain-containing protein n=1 Tax=Polytolypa hystricis (strain UAMH7299) TaxID=1447883 RepID=A0A2B7Z1Q9_POLH7|nr:hypothetical protein AJ80_01531 [Polytolypa hystricis UAMH7299]
MHCTSGKDHTGVLGALILSLCGVPDEVVAGEYNLTEAWLGAWMDHMISAMVKQGVTGERNARRMIGARRASMLDSLSMLRKEFGGAEGYFQTECGLSKDELDKIKPYLIVDEAPVCGL